MHVLHRMTLFCKIFRDWGDSGGMSSALASVVSNYMSEMETALVKVLWLTLSVVTLIVA